MRRLFAIIALIPALAACAHDDARRHAQEFAASGRLAREDVRAGEFLIATWSRFDDPGQAVHAYIEGDGHAWLSRHRLSSDPTPRQALGLALAAADPAPNVVYLARPCQYMDLQQRPCDSKWWSGARFAEPVVRSEDEALSSLMRRTPGQRMHLIGYSGGAAIAVLLAARRADVASLRTVAGNLDSEAVNRLHAVSPMPDSLNPFDAAAAVAGIPQVHFTGGADRIVPAAIAQGFVQAMPDSRCARVEMVQGATHEAGWRERWPELLRLAPVCRP